MYTTTSRQTKGKTPLKVLRTARKRLDKGWTSGSWKSLHKGSDGKGKTQALFCIEGALTGGASLADVEDIEGMKHPICRAGLYVRQAIREYKELDFEAHIDIPSYNDAEFTKEDVLAVMDIAIAKAELDEGPVVLDKVKMPAAAEMNTVSAPKKTKDASSKIWGRKLV